MVRVQSLGLARKQNSVVLSERSVFTGRRGRKTMPILFLVNKTNQLESGGCCMTASVYSRNCRHIRRSTSLLFGLLLTAAILPLPAHGQGLPASLTGIIQDQSKAMIPGADITLTHEATGTVR